MKNILILPLLLLAIYCSAQSRIVGKPIKVGNYNYEVAQFDFPNEMNWDDASKACQSLGKGWRLPTKQELSTLFKKKDKIGGFKGKIYWSSVGRISSFTEPAKKAWVKIFEKGKNYGREGVSKKEAKCSVRAVRYF